MFTGDANDASFINTSGTLVSAANGGSDTRSIMLVVNGVEFASIAGTNIGRTKLGFWKLLVPNAQR